MVEGMLAIGNGRRRKVGPQAVANWVEWGRKEVVRAVSIASFALIFCGELRIPWGRIARRHRALPMRWQRTARGFPNGLLFDCAHALSRLYGWLSACPPHLESSRPNLSWELAAFAEFLGWECWRQSTCTSSRVGSRSC